MADRYFLCFGKLYRAPESWYHDILTMVRDARPFNLRDMPLVVPCGDIGVDVGKISREQAQKELRKEYVAVPADPDGPNSTEQQPGDRQRLPAEA